MVVSQFLLDTNIILYLLGGRLAEPLPEGNYYFSVMTEMELLSYPDLDKQTEQKIRDFLAQLTLINLEEPIKTKTIQLRRQHTLKLPDAIIVATALTLNVPLLSNDLRLNRLSDLDCRQLKMLDLPTS
ncbi:MAG: type II toxin-antitoxin system VapC family toxin [Gammaproteobacteria bacterium]|nr:MAG: type II toxin-antitoxin system VapC family toxin [Gammaproteobacteria bacterium]RKZ40477.1 MAG: type II toxin-antitoxin system VapC family toxin [Gammaproteobacteria bacterium]RKZ73143.1 MAG: type II toxin-antitoxin system VapC family toxin [Gammaproteobacteria bacterium]